MPSRWIASARHDLIFFHLSGLFALSFIVPYLWFGDRATWAIYNVYFVLFGLPHNFMTWSTLLPAGSREGFRWNAIARAAVFCFFLCALLPFCFNREAGDWILSFIAYYALWHAYRQHHGIAKIYDLVQARRFGDDRLLEDRKALNLFFGLSVMLVVVWAFTKERIEYLIPPAEPHQLIHPVVPWPAFLIYCAATAVAGVVAFRTVIWNRWRRGVFIPWPQISLMTIAIATNVIPYLMIGDEAAPVRIAIATVFHNIQYFGFVWLFEKTAATLPREAQEAISLPRRFAGRGAWKRYGALALGYSFAVSGAFLLLPRGYGFALISFLALSHHIIDGLMWKRINNLRLRDVLSRWSATPAPEQAAKVS